VIGLFVTIARAMQKHCRQLDISVEISGPHGLAVRETRSRQARVSRPSHPASNVRDDREAPLLSGAGQPD
jgi:hypothetical protein